MKTKRALLLALSCTLLLDAAPPAQGADVGLRRTLFAPAGQRRVLLEAPVGMCFLDPAFFGGNAVYKSARDFVKAAEAGTLLGVFSRCGDISADEGEGAPVFGVVTWLNPMAGETSDLALEDYLDQQEAQFRDGLDDLLGDAQAPDGRKNADPYAALPLLPAPGQYVFADETKRSPDGVTVAYSAEVKNGFDKRKTAGIVGTTLAYKTPVGVLISYAPKSEVEDLLYQRMMDKMLAQHVALNGPVAARQ